MGKKHKRHREPKVENLEWFAKRVDDNAKMTEKVSKVVDRIKLAAQQTFRSNS